LLKLGFIKLYEKEFNDAMRKYRSLIPSYQSKLRIPEDPSLLQFYDVLVPAGDEATPVTLSGSVELTKDGDKNRQVARFPVDRFYYGDEFTADSRLQEEECKLDDPKSENVVKAIIQDRKTFVAEVNSMLRQQ